MLDMSLKKLQNQSCNCKKEPFGLYIIAVEVRLQNKHLEVSHRECSHYRYLKTYVQFIISSSIYCKVFFSLSGKGLFSNLDVKYPYFFQSCFCLWSWTKLISLLPLGKTVAALCGSLKMKSFLSWFFPEGRSSLLAVFCAWGWRFNFSLLCKCFSRHRWNSSY